jgi:predicted transcriptional regulator
MISSLTMPRWNDVLLAMYKSREDCRYCEKLNRTVRASRTHIREIIRAMARHGLIEIIESSKIKRLELTEKGKKIAAYVLGIRSELSRP